MTTFATAGPVSAHIDLALGDIRVATGAPDEVSVEVAPADPGTGKDRQAAAATQVAFSEGRLDVIGPRPLLAGTRAPGSVTVTVTLPSGSGLDAETAVGLVTVQGELGAVRARTSAGDIRVEDVATAELRAGMGAITARHVAGDARCSTGTGAVDIERIDGSATVKNSNGPTRIGDSGGPLRVKAANGDVTVDRARADVVATSANGRLRVGAAEQGSVHLRTSVGTITLGIAEGTAARLDLRTSFGRVRNELDPADAPAAEERILEVDAQTSAGDIVVVRAAAALR